MKCFNFENNVVPKKQDLQRQQTIINSLGKSHQSPFTTFSYVKSFHPVIKNLNYVYITMRNIQVTRYLKMSQIKKTSVWFFGQSFLNTISVNLDKICI